MLADRAAEPHELTAERYEALIRIANAIRAGKDARDFFAVLSRELSKVIRLDAIAQFDSAANKVNLHFGTSCCIQEIDPAELSAEENLPAWVYRTQKTVVLETVAAEAQFPAFARLMRQVGLESVCAFPLTTHDRQLGSLIIGSTLPKAYSSEDVAFGQFVADQIALAVDYAMNFQASQGAQERLRLLLDVTNRVVSNLDLRDVLRAISAQIRCVMDCDAVGIALPSSKSNNAIRVYAVDYPNAPPEIEEGYETESSEVTLAVQVFRTGEPVILVGEEIQRERLATGHGVQSIVHVPLAGREGVAGVLSMGTHREFAFRQEDLPFLKQIGCQVAIAIENARTFEEVSDQRKHLALEKLYLEDELRSELKFEEIVGQSEALSRVLEQIKIVAPTDSTVLICGETGSGKELIARAVHNLSTRRSEAFVKLNCAAIPTGLLESELFGHEKGAFTGAISQRIGRFELASRGTMFLDEIGEVPLELQPKLLRVLQEREFERLGSTRTLRTDARLIAATNRDLEKFVADGKFRSDLYYRLNVFPVRVPPLRERPEDIPVLARHFVQQFSRRLGKVIEAISAETMRAMVSYEWPGNVRELQNVIERAVILSTGSVLSIRKDDLRTTNGQPVTQAHSANRHARPAALGHRLRSALEETERQQILAALEQSNWIVAGPEGAAARLGVKRSTLQSRMAKLGIRISRTGA
jgi:formate hydrogenlyase transcriptional activator